jgi:hypothetical protein
MDTAACLWYKHTSWHGFKLLLELLNLTLLLVVLLLITADAADISTAADTSTAAAYCSIGRATATTSSLSNKAVAVLQTNCKELSGSYDQHEHHD